MKEEIRAKRPELKNDALEAAVREAIELKDAAEPKKRETVAKLAAEFRGSRLLVPVEFPEGMDQKSFLAMAKSGKMGKNIKFRPIIITHPNDKKYAPAFTSGKQLPKDHKFQAVITVPFMQVLTLTTQKELKLDGILINPSTDKMILHPPMLEAMRNAENHKLAAAGSEKKEIKMTAEQFRAFARKNIELGIMPKAAHTQKQTFMDRLEEGGEKFIASLYRQPYGDKVPCPYSEDQFRSMILNIDEETQVAAVELPSAKILPGMAISAYFIWNPLKDTMRYFTIEKGEAGSQNVLCTVAADGRHTELKSAPNEGSEIYTILELIREETEERLREADADQSEHLS